MTGADRKAVKPQSTEEKEWEEQYKNIVAYISEVESRVKTMEAALFRNGIRV
jgi:hypothetical protein